jgi:hypothetical protein
MEKKVRATIEPEIKALAKATREAAASVRPTTS